MRTYLEGTQLKALAALTGAAVVALFFGWQVRHFTHMAGQGDSRTLITWEYIPVLLLSFGIFAIRSQAPWMLRRATQPIGRYAALAAGISVLPAIAVPFGAAALLRAVPVAWVPGRDPLDDQPMIDVMPWEFVGSLIPLTLICAGAGLLLEAALGKGFGSFGPPLAYAAVVAVQSAGLGGFLSGAPGVFDPVLTPAGVALGAGTLALGLVVFALVGGGHSGLCQGRR